MKEIEITCPHCNHVHKDWKEYEFTEGEHEFDGKSFPLPCEVCGKEIDVNANVRYSAK